MNTGAIVEHDVRIGAYVHISPGALVASRGRSATAPCRHRGRGHPVRADRGGALVAAGAVVVDDVEPGARVAGVPARRLAEP